MIAELIQGGGDFSALVESVHAEVDAERRKRGVAAYDWAGAAKKRTMERSALRSQHSTKVCKQNWARRRFKKRLRIRIPLEVELEKVGS